MIEVGDLEFDPERRVLRRGAVEVRITPRVSNVFGMLAARGAGRVVSKNQAMDGLYGHDPDPPFDKVVDVFICKIREALRRLGSEVSVKTRWGYGWELVVPRQVLTRAELVEALSASAAALEGAGLRDDALRARDVIKRAA